MGWRLHVTETLRLRQECCGGGRWLQGRVCQYISETSGEAMAGREEHSGFGKVLLASSWVLRGAYGSKIFTTWGPSSTHSMGRQRRPVQVCVAPSEMEHVLCGALGTQGRLCVPPARASSVYTAQAWGEEGGGEQCPVTLTGCLLFRAGFSPSAESLATGKNQLNRFFLSPS